MPNWERLADLAGTDQQAKQARHSGRALQTLNRHSAVQRDAAS
ncbi:MAG TPA: hypothetical protein VGL77_08745 [Armatimonadota bacterium]